MYIATVHPLWIKEYSMPITNEEIASVLYNIADILEDQEENPYRVRAYRRAANSIKRFSKNINDLLLAEEDLTIISGVGKHLAEKIKQIVITENYTFTYEAKPPQLYPVKLLQKKRTAKFRIYSVIPIAERWLRFLKGISEIKKAALSGDLRRKKDTITELCIVICTTDIPNTFKAIHTFPGIKYLVETKTKSTTVLLKIGLFVTIYVASEKTFAGKLLTTTGSSSHLEALKQRKKHLNGPSEEHIYHSLGLQYIPPELRENQGEIVTAEKHQIPLLVELKDIKGDLHCHTNETDGTYTLEEMIEAAQQQGYEYVAITDHSQSLKITRGMNEKRLLQQIKQIDRLNETLSHFTILKSMEVDILEDGNLDLSNEVLKELDLTVCSIHSKFKLSLEQQTERVIRAMDNPYFNILGHATGRLLFGRPPYPINIDKIIEAAKARHCFLEVNAQPARLDINDIYCRKAKQMGVKVAISSDAHTTRGFTFMSLGINQARRGWLEAKDVINTYSLHQLKKVLKRS
jgi:DNA polymerase (family 10)